MNATPTTTHYRRKHREESWPKYGLFILGFSVTLYLDLVIVGGFDVRPVQLVPVLIAFVAIPFLPSIRGDVSRICIVLPCVWACYMLARHVAFDNAGPSSIQAGRTASQE